MKLAGLLLAAVIVLAAPAAAQECWEMGSEPSFLCGFSLQFFNESTWPGQDFINCAEHVNVELSDFHAMGTYVYNAFETDKHAGEKSFAIHMLSLGLTNATRGTESIHNAFYTCGVETLKKASAHMLPVMNALANGHGDLGDLFGVKAMDSWANDLDGDWGDQQWVMHGKMAAQIVCQYAGVNGYQMPGC
eukprot:PLAT14514.1.p2 GENE.PLAT14514.1~~PLAT14514.1.p2  ORF type:complete len:200 (+),score=72.79 PLAT14514.1:32-601(+)